MSRDRWASASAFALLGVAALAKLPTLGQPLTENFAWRQTQTAWTARIFHEQGIDLLRPQVPVHGPPWGFGFEFPLFQALGSLLMDLGLGTDLAMRTLGLLTFLVTGWLLFVLARQLAGPVVAVVALGAFLFSPFGLLWGRTSLIEYLATAMALAFLIASTRWLDTRRPAAGLAAAFFGCLAMLVKITTGAFYLLPLLVYRTHGRAVLVRDWSAPALVAMPSIVGVAWIRYIDAVKAATPATAFQTSAEMVAFNFGSPDLRADPVALAPIAAALALGLGGGGLVLWIPAAAAAIGRLAQGPFVATLLVSTLLGAPLVLTPLYATQAYYPAAISPAAALLVGLGAGWAWERRDDLAGRIALVGGTALWIVTLVLTRDLWLASYEPVVDRDGSLAAAAYVRERTAPDDWVVVAGRGWDPTILYYAHRRGYMLDERRRPLDDLEALRADPRYRLFVSCPYQAPCSPIEPEP